MNYLLLGQTIASISVGIMIIALGFGLWADNYKGPSVLARWSVAIFLCRISFMGFLISLIFMLSQ